MGTAGRSGPPLVAKRPVQRQPLVTRRNARYVGGSGVPMRASSAAIYSSVAGGAPSQSERSTSSGCRSSTSGVR